MAKIKKLVELAGMITLYPDRHNQSTWFSGVHSTTKLSTLRPENNGCGTTLCAAGWTAALYAPKKSVFVPTEEEYFFVPAENGEYQIDGDDYEETFYVNTAGKHYDMVYIPSFASEELDLTPDQATSLFYNSSSSEDVLNVIRAIIANPKISGDELDILISHDD